MQLMHILMLLITTGLKDQKGSFFKKYIQPAPIEN